MIIDKVGGIIRKEAGLKRKWVGSIKRGGTKPEKKKSRRGQIRKGAGLKRT